MPGGEGRVRCPRAWPHQLRSRAVRASCLPALRPVRGVHRCKWVRRRRREARPVDAASHEAWPGPRLGDEILSLARAVVERRQASAPDSGRVGASRLDPWRDRTRWCGTDDSATAGVPLPYFFLSSLRAQAKQSSPSAKLGCLVAIAPRNDGHERETKWMSLFPLSPCGRGWRSRA